MCESDVYFETYRHVYSVLKSFTEETFPMKNYIINVEVSIYHVLARLAFTKYFLSIVNATISQLHTTKRSYFFHLQTTHS